MFSSIGWRDAVALSSVLLGIAMIACAVALTP